jgi:hypothetical protein
MERISKEEHIHYLRMQLIPDLLESGHTGTAEDFELCCRFMEGQTLLTLPGPASKDVDIFFNEWKNRG